MSMLGGLNHIGLRSGDVDRLVEFYRTVFGAPVIRDTTDGGARHVIVDVGGGDLLEIFGATDTPEHPGGADGHPDRLDHLALAAPDRETFGELRGRLMEAGHSDGQVRDAGVMWVLDFRDPDGATGQLVWANPDVPVVATGPRDRWEPVPADRLAGRPG